MSAKSTKTKNEVTVVSRDDIKAKMSEINNALDGMKESSMSTLKVALICGVTVLVGLAFLSGHRKAARPKTLLKIIKTK